MLTVICFFYSLLLPKASPDAPLDSVILIDSLIDKYGVATAFLDLIILNEFIILLFFLFFTIVLFLGWLTESWRQIARRVSYRLQKLVPIDITPNLIDLPTFLGEKLEDFMCFKLVEDTQGATSVIDIGATLAMIVLSEVILQHPDLINFLTVFDIFVSWRDRLVL